MRIARWSWCNGATLRRRIFAVALSCAASVDSLAGAPPRGDVDGDGSVTIGDSVELLRFLFAEGPAAECAAVADANSDVQVDVSDAVAILLALFLSGPPLLPLDETRCDPCSLDDASGGPPTFTTVPMVRTYPGEILEVPLIAADPEGSALLYEADGLPTGASVEPDSGMFSWRPDMDQVGSYELAVSISDEGCPPNRVSMPLLVHVLPLDPCSRPVCDPELGCEHGLPPLEETCCAGDAPRVPEPDFVPDPGCPAGGVLHIGTNSQNALTIGRLANCDRLRLVSLGQGGHILRFNIETRCLDPDRVEVHARLETASVVLVNKRFTRDLDARADGFLETRRMEAIAEGLFDEGEEAQLTVVATDALGTALRRHVRLKLTRQSVDELP